MNKNTNWKTWEPREQAGIDAKVAYIELEANQRASRMRGLTDAQKAAYAEELIIEDMKKYFPNGVPTKEPSALDKALARVSRTQQAEQQYRDNQGRFSGGTSPYGTTHDNSDHTLFDEPVDILDRGNR